MHCVYVTAISTSKAYIDNCYLIGYYQWCSPNILTRGPLKHESPDYFIQWSRSPIKTIFGILN